MQMSKPGPTKQGVDIALARRNTPISGVRLRRALTAPMVVLYGLGVTIGAGIYVLVGATAAEAGAFAPIAFLVAAAVVAFTALSYSELSTRYPVSAGEAAYVEAGLNSGLLAASVGLLVAASGIVSAAAVAIGAASYLSELWAVPEAFLTASIVGAMTLVALWGITQSVAVAGAITLVEISGLLLVIYWGFGVAEPNGVPIAATFAASETGHWIGIGSASVLAFFAFVGFEDIANVAEEVKDPTRTMPKAIIWTLLLATILYVATTVAVLVAVPISSLASSSSPLTLVFDGAEQNVRNTFALIAVVATINGVLIQMIMASRVVYGLADRNHLPSVLAKVWPSTQTPAVATLAVAFLILLLSQTVPIEALAERTSQIVLTVFAVVNLSLIRLKVSGEKTLKAFSVPFAVPIFGMITSVALLFISVF